MLLPLPWLKQFVTVSESVDKVAERFIGLGFECEVVGNETIDLEITPNRGDALSILGLAREYAAATNQPLIFPQYEQLKWADRLPHCNITADPKTYLRLAAAVVGNITIGPSPDWLRQAVSSVGMNSINNLVDLTNYVMFELGIPLHAFDLDQLKPELQLRLSQAGEHFVSLKDEAFNLPADAIVVENDGELIDLLGIRGGKRGIIKENTRNTLIWAASVPRPLIRQASRALNLRTEASYRHERETDWSMVPVALERMITLLKQTIGGETIAAIQLEGSERVEKQIEVTKEQVNRLLGTQFEKSQIDSYLERLGFGVSGNYYTVPSWRYFDMNYPQDLVEEVARIAGYDQLPRAVIESQAGSEQTEFARLEYFKDQLVSEGYSEVYTESFSGREETAAGGYKTENLPTLANPVNRDFAYCRAEITPNLIKLLALNSWSDDAKIFEVGNVFPTLTLEETHLAIAAYGDQTGQFAAWLPAKYIKRISPEHPLARLYKLRRLATVAETPIDEINLKEDYSFIRRFSRPNYKPISPYPPSVRDISVLIDRSVSPERLAKELADLAPEQIVLVELFDQFSADSFGQDRQSLAFHLVYQSGEKTFANDEVEVLHQKVVNFLKQTYQATIR